MGPRSFWLVLCFVCLSACSKHEKLGQLPFTDDFERTDLGDAWQSTPGWSIRDGQLFSAGTQNRAIWLRLTLPKNVIIEFDARSESPDGDIKFEVFGNGHDHASGYILIFGGWRNSISTIARLDEHGQDRQELRKRNMVQMGRTYHMRFERRGKVLKWSLDGKLLLDFYDSEPLYSKEHDRFGFNNWKSNLYFDNLRITANPS